MRRNGLQTGVAKLASGVSYIGRVGALAAAMGIGAALASTPVIAVADESPPGSAGPDVAGTDVDTAAKPDAAAKVEDPRSRAVRLRRPSAVTWRPGQAHTSGDRRHEQAARGRAAEPEPATLAVIARPARGTSPEAESKVAQEPAVRPRLRSARFATSRILDEPRAIAARPQNAEALTGALLSVLVGGVPEVLAPRPADPVGAPVIWGVLAWARRQHHIPLPTPEGQASSLQTSKSMEEVTTLEADPGYTVGIPDADGAVTGAMTPTWTGDEPSVFLGSSEGYYGTVVVNEDGTFTYYPSALARENASVPDAGSEQQTYVFSIAEQYPDGSGVVFTTVSVPIAPTDWVPPAPEPPPPVPVEPGAVVSGGGVVVPEVPLVPIEVIEVIPAVETVPTESVGPAGEAREQPPRTTPERHDSSAGSHDVKVTPPPVHVKTLSDPALTLPPISNDVLPDSFIPPPVTPAVLVQLQVAFFALAATMFGGESLLRGVGGLAVPAGGGAQGGAAKLSGAGSASFKAVGAVAGSGDRSRSLRWAGTRRFDRAMRTLPVRLAPLSPMLARIAVDGSWIRAMMGTWAMLLPAVGLVLGVLVLRDTGSMPTPPSVALLTAVAVLGVWDALAGLIAVTVVVGGVAMAGHLGTAPEIRTMLGIAVVCFAVPLIAGAARPLRRVAAQSVSDWREWVGDIAIASLIGAWATQKMIAALPGLAGRPLPIVAHAVQVALIVLGACALRIVAEAAAARWYPSRLSEVQPTSIPKPVAVQRIIAAVVRTGLLLFVASAFLGNHWQLWVGGLLFLAPQVLAAFDDRLPNSPRLHRVLPRGIVKLVIMLAIGAGCAILVKGAVATSANPVLDSFVFLAIPTALLTALELFGREGETPDEGWGRWLGGAGFLGIGVWLVLFVLP